MCAAQIVQLYGLRFMQTGPLGLFECKNNKYIPYYQKLLVFLHKNIT